MASPVILSAVNILSLISSFGFAPETPMAEDLGWVPVLALMLIPGAFGGILSVLQLLEIRRLISGKSVIGHAKHFSAALALGAIGGCGGALAMLLIGVWTNQLDFHGTTHNYLLFVSLGMVSGFLGFKLLKSVATNLEKQIHDIETKTQDQIEVVKDQLIEDDSTIDKGKLIRDNPTAPAAEIEEIIPELIRVTKRRPTDRTASILLGNLYDRIRKHQEAISAVTDTLEAKRQAGSADDKDAADLLFNRACYRVPLWKEQADPQQKKRLRDAIIKDLKQSFELSPANRIEAKTDDDLVALGDDEEFKKIVPPA